MEKLQGSPDKLMVKQSTPERIKTYGMREDQTPKGPGFFGEISRTDKPEMFSTELSATAGLKDASGKEVLFPLIVPTLTAEELAHLVDGGKPTKAIYQKAIAFAASRLKEGKSPFADVGEQLPLLPKTVEKNFEEGFRGQ